YNFKFLDQDFELAAGAMDRNKNRDNFYNEYNLTPKSGSDGYPIKYPGLEVPYNGTPLDPNLFVFSSSDAAQGSPINPNTYKVTENILGYYFQAKADLWKRLEILGGFRFENTYQSFTNVMPKTFVNGNAGTITYSDIMPSIHFKYKINTKQNLRLSYFNSIMRPGFFEITPYQVSSGDVFIEQGNPFIKHAIAYNYDIRYEWFPKGLDQVLVGVFYKKIENPIEIALLASGTSSTVVQPNNFGTATNYGFELALTKYFGVFGLSGNYTFTQSAITTTKKTYDENHVFGTQDQTRPLQGQSPHIANISVLYKDSKLGLDLQLACVYTGQKIALLSNYYNLDYWQKEMVTLDFSFEKTFLKHFSIYGKAQNLLNTPYILEIHHQNIYKTGSLVLTDQTSDNSIIVQKDYYGQNFILGIRFKLKN
ncbi:MAG: TonB-dependent receptor, partial [Cytophagales bacterium]|nr:TonB-dependent receptor [Cytophagales bacterium]